MHDVFVCVCVCAVDIVTVFANNLHSVFSDFVLHHFVGSPSADLLLLLLTIPPFLSFPLSVSSFRLFILSHSRAVLPG